MFASILLSFASLVTFVQDPPPPPPPAAPTPPGAPIDSGVIILFCVALAYGAYKAYKFSNKKINY